MSIWGEIAVECGNKESVDKIQAAVFDKAFARSYDVKTAPTF